LRSPPIDAFSVIMALPREGCGAFFDVAVNKSKRVEVNAAVSRRIAAAPGLGYAGRMSSWRAEFSAQAAFAGALSAFVGFASTFAVVLKGLTGAGASPDQAASGLLAVSLAMGLCAVFLSLRTRLPISVAWSTPGAALLAASSAPAGGFAEAVGAFIAASAAIVLAGFWRPFGRTVAAIPSPLANAMLAGVLLGLCLAPFKAVAQMPALALPIVLAWAVTMVWKRLYAMPVAVAVTLAVILFAVPLPEMPAAALAPKAVFVAPSFSAAALIGIALPLFLVTMASQNIPGIAVLQANGYAPAPGPLLRWTGAFGLVAAPFGSHAVNLAAITAALCAGEGAHPDPKRRYWAAVVAGLGYALFGLAAGAATAFIAAAPPILIEAVAGLALLGACAAALLAALQAPEDREAAMVTFLVTASGIAFFGIGGAFWGLVAGGVFFAALRWRRRAATPK
jgi:benzoate membrane transport protein